MSTGPIDVFCHCLPPAFCRGAERLSATLPWMYQRAQRNAALVDIDARLRIMDEFDGYRQVLSLASPTIEQLVEPAQGAELARIGNDAMAELVGRYPDRFVGFAASIPMSEGDQAVREAERAISTLNASGVQFYTNVSGKPLDHPEVFPVVEHVAALGRPIWMHPIRLMSHADYQTEAISKFDLWWALGWPCETSVAMARLVFTGIFDRFPDLVLITHHVGGTMPMMEGRLDSGLKQMGIRNPPDVAEQAGTKGVAPPVSAFKKFHADTASFGSRSAIECGMAFFGIDRLMFGTDMPFDPDSGPGYIRSTLTALSDMGLSDKQRDAILFDNARRILRLT